MLAGKIDEDIHGCVLHLDIKKGKIWIQHDGTEVGIANELVNLGVPKEDIVLAFHEPLSQRIYRVCGGLILIREKRKFA
jgi:hypothetical protein